jgi:glycosidase
VEPWLPIGEANAERDVDTQQNNPQSILNFYRRLLMFRRMSPALKAGSFQMLDESGDEYVLFERRTKEEYLIVGLNFGEKAQQPNLPVNARTVFSSDKSEEGILGPFEGKIFRVE